MRNLVVTGSVSMTPLIREIGQRFEATHADVRVDVQADGSARGVAETTKGLADIGMVARALKPDETNLHATPIARDGLCILVHRSNSVKTLTDEHIVKAYTRGVANWKQIGGPDRPIVLVHLKDGRAIVDLFLDHFKLKATQIRADALVGDSPQAIEAVASRPGALAYVSCSAAESVGEKSPISILPSGGVAPTPETIRDGTYPLSRPLNLVTREEPKGLAKEFIEFARSNAVADLLAKYHYVTLEKQHP